MTLVYEFSIRTHKYRYKIKWIVVLDNRETSTTLKKEKLFVWGYKVLIVLVKVEQEVEGEY